MAFKTDLTRMISKVPAIPMDPTAVLRVVEQYLDYAKCREQEITKRVAVSAWRDTEVERIRSEKKVMLAYLKREYRDRAKVYDLAFAALDKGIDSGSPEAIQAACTIISQQIATNPFLSLQEFRQQRLSGKDLDF
jgi:hypothetical protein